MDASIEVVVEVRVAAAPSLLSLVLEDVVNMIDDAFCSITATSIEVFVVVAGVVAAIGADEAAVDI
jgi:hypothetical protein